MYAYSKKNNAFYLIENKELYEINGTWSDDCIHVSNSIYNEFAASAPPAGKVRAAGEDGFPVWVDLPPPTDDEIIEINELNKKQLIENANTIITPLQDAVELEMATDEEVELLKQWKKYRVLLNRLDVNDLNIEFPEKPE